MSLRVEEGRWGEGGHAPESIAIDQAFVRRHLGVIAFRDDGWPLCPRCGEDELYTLREPPTIRSVHGCYRCGPLAVIP